MQIALNLVLNTTLLLSICILFNLFYQKLSSKNIWFRLIGGVVIALRALPL
jgi:hypothetical protein